MAILGGTVGDDTRIGGTGSDSLFGGLGDDILYGGNGSDVLQGNEGTNLLYGGNGGDAFVASSVGGVYYVWDYADGLDGIFALDSLDYTSVTRTVADLDGDGAADDLRVQLINSELFVFTRATFLILNDTDPTTLFV